MQARLLTYVYGYGSMRGMKKNTTIIILFILVTILTYSIYYLCNPLYVVTETTQYSTNGVLDKVEQSTTNIYSCGYTVTTKRPTYNVN